MFAMRRRTLLRSTPPAALPALPALLAACTGGAEAPQAKSSEPVTLRHVPWPGIPASRAAQTAVVEDWNRRHPAVQIREEELAGEGNHYQKLIVQIAGGGAPDLTFMQGSHDYVAFATRGQLLPIESYISRDRAFDRRERLHPRSRDIVELRGHTWGLPIEAATYVLFYNRALLDHAGVAPPKKGDTWQTLLAAAQKLTRETGAGTQYGYAQNLAIGRLEPWVAQNGARLLDAVAFPTKQRLDSPDVIAALGFVHDLAWRHRVMPAGSESTAIAKMWEGQHALRQDGSWLAIDFSKNMKQPWGWAPLPRGKGEATWMSVDVNVAFKSTAHPEACYNFLKFINKEGQAPMIEHWARMPVTLNDDSKQTYIRYLKSLGIEDWEVAWSAWEAGYSSHLTPAWPDLEREVFAPALRTLFGPDGAGASVATTLQSLAGKAQQLLAEQGQPPK